MFATRHGVAEGDWDSALLAMNGHFLQSAAWQRVQRALGYDVMWRRSDAWMWSGALRAGRFPRYVYMPYGPALAAQPEEALESAAHAARHASLDFVRAEPDGAGVVTALRTVRAVATHQIQPATTWVLDIDVAEATLRGGLSAGHRGAINAAERRGLTVRSSREPRDMTAFIQLQRRSSGYTGRPAAYHRTVADVLMPLDAATLYVASAAGAPVAAAVAFDFGPTRYYAHAVSDPGAGRKLGAAAPLVWRMILDARTAGMRHFDFWGVVLDAPDAHPWSGFSRFKMAFGGRAVRRAGTWDIPVRSTRYRLYRAALRMRR